MFLAFLHIFWHFEYILGEVKCLEVQWNSCYLQIYILRLSKVTFTRAAFLYFYDLQNAKILFLPCDIAFVSQGGRSRTNAKFQRVLQTTILRYIGCSCISSMIINKYWVYGCIHIKLMLKEIDINFYSTYRQSMCDSLSCGSYQDDNPIHTIHFFQLYYFKYENILWPLGI